MSIIRYNPSWDPFAEMAEFMNMLPEARRESMQKMFVPAMDIYESKDSIFVETPLAGVDPKDVEVSVEKGVLTVQGKTKKEHEIEDANYYRKEIRSGSFYRQIALPGPVKEDKVTAEFQDGVLKINCPKSAPASPKKISVKIIKKNDKK